MFATGWECGGTRANTDRHLETRWKELARYEPGRFSGRAIVIRCVPVA